MTGSVSFAEALSDVSAGNVKIPQTKFQQSGPLAVVDQGQSLVAGFTNDLSAAVRSPAPLIVFGDHTRAVKYVDFPFAMGADGVKVLQVRDGFDPKYVYYYLRYRDIPNAGYSRHFKYLKELQVPKPSLREQRRVVAILDHADALRVKRRSALRHLDSLIPATFQSYFGDPLAAVNDPTARTLRDWIDPERPITYGILKPGPHIEEGIPYVRVADMQDRVIKVENVRRTTDAIAAEYRRSTLKAGDLLMSIRGHVGRFALVPQSLDGANITQDSARLAVVGDDATTFVRVAMECPSVQHWMARRTKGAAVKGINLGDLRELPLITPPAERIRDFSNLMKVLEEQRAVASASVVPGDALFASLESSAFRRSCNGAC